MKLNNEYPTHKELKTLYIIQLIVSIITIILVIFTILMFIVFKKIKTYYIELVVYLCISEFFNNIFSLISPFIDSNNICKLQAFVDSTFPMTSTIIVTFISLTAYVNTIYEDKLIKYKKYYRIVVLLTSLCLSVIFGLM